MRIRISSIEKAVDLSKRKIFRKWEFISTMSTMKYKKQSFFRETSLGNRLKCKEKQFGAETGFPYIVKRSYRSWPKKNQNLILRRFLATGFIPNCWSQRKSKEVFDSTYWTRWSMKKGSRCYPKLEPCMPLQHCATKNSICLKRSENTLTA